MQSSRSKRELADKLDIWILMIVSFLALIITLYSWLSLIKSFGFTGLDLTTSVYLVLTIFSLIGITIGLERYGVLEGMRKDQSEANRALHASIPCRALIKPRKITKKAGKLFKLATGIKIFRPPSFGPILEDRSFT